MTSPHDDVPAQADPGVSSGSGQPLGRPDVFARITEDSWERRQAAEEAEKARKRASNRDQLSGMVAGAIMAVALIALLAHWGLRHVDSLQTLIDWSGPVFEAAMGVLFCASAAEQWRRSRTDSDDRLSFWPVALLVALGWFGLAIHDLL